MPAIAKDAKRPVVISGPSGAGKSTILKRLFDEYPNEFGFSVSHTTRRPRAGEQHGREYYFVTVDEFQKLVDEGGFLEHARFGDNRYGSSVAAVEAVMKQGKTCILDIEMEGVKQVKASRRLHPRFLFLSPPSLEVLESRLRGRGTDSEDAVLKRLARAKDEMEFSKRPGVHDKIVVNDDLEAAYKEVKEFILGKNDEAGK